MSIFCFWDTFQIPFSIRNWRVCFPFRIDLHSLSASFLFPALLNLKRKFEFFFSTLFSPVDTQGWSKQLLKNEFYCGEIIFSIHSGAGNNFFLTFHSCRNRRVGGVWVKECYWGGVGNGIVDYYNLYTSTYSVYCEDNFL